MFILSTVPPIGVSFARNISAAPAAGPKYSNFAVTSVRAGNSPVFATKWADTSGLLQYIFSFDAGSRTLVNGTATAFGGTSNWSNTSETLSLTTGTKIQWKVFAKNTINLWNSTYTMCASTGFNGNPLGSQFASIVDDCYDLLAYDGIHVYNLGNLPQLFRVNAGGAVGYHGIQWDSAMDTTLIVGYNNALIRYTSIGGTLTVLGTGLASIGLNGVGWRPSDNSFALIPGDGGTLLQYNGGMVSVLLTGTTNSLKKVAWNPSGNYALVVGESGTILKYNFASGVVSTVASGVST